MKFIVKKLHCVWYVCFKGISTAAQRLGYILEIHKVRPVIFPGPGKPSNICNKSMRNK